MGLAGLFNERLDFDNLFRMDNLIFALKDVYFSYLERYPALCGIDMRVSRGEKIALLGANGTGKSTLLHLLDGLIFPDRGSITALERELKESAFFDSDFNRYFRSRVGLVFQNPEVQLFCPTVKEDIIFGPLQLGLSPAEIKKRLEYFVELFRLQELIPKSPHQLSLGEKRKVAIASTLIMEPEVILLDEPTAGLDPQTSTQVIDIIIRAHEEGKTIVTSTQDLHIVEEIADTVYVFGQDKKIARRGPSHQLLTDNEFLAQNNLVHTHIHRHKDKSHIHHHCHYLDHHPE